MFCLFVCVCGGGVYIKTDVTKSHCSSPLNLTSRTSLSLSMMSPFGLKVWHGQWTLISKPILDPAIKKRQAFINLNGNPLLFLMITILSYYEMRKYGDLRLTSLHQPLPHCFGHIKGNPFCGTFGQHILGSNEALLSNVFISPHDL